jgi:uncharacterized protein (TIGR00369 family)
MADERIYGLASREALAGESGLEFLRGLIDGRHPAPPFSRTTRTYLVVAEEGRVLFKGTPDETFFNPLGTIHGGWTAGILDSAMACAVHSTLKVGQGYTTMEFKVNLVRAIAPSSGELICEGILVHRGGTVATSEGYLRDAEGRLVAHGTETCLIFDASRAKRG